MADLIDTTEMYLTSDFELRDAPARPHRGTLLGGLFNADGRPHGA